MGKYSRESIQQVLAANDIVDVIGQYVDLKPAGSDRFLGLSPFQSEKTPSFNVSRSRQAYYCFSTDQGGDLITFLQAVEGLSFVEAVERLADRAGIRLPKPGRHDSREEYERERLYELGAFARKHFMQMLADPLKGGAGRTYLKTRALRDETAKHFGIGFAADSFNNLLDAARTAGFDERILELSGLAKRGTKGNLYDFFRSRLITPIRDVNGRVVAFGGRDITGEAPGKYINSPENPVYKKAKTLYALYEAKEAIRKSGRALLAEGYFDVLRLHDSGICNAVATCGTALTPDQAQLLRRYCREAVLVYDGDNAGLRAAARGSGILIAAGLTVRILTLSDGMDPDDFVRAEGPDAFAAAIESADSFVPFYAEANRARLTSIEGRHEVAQELFAIVRDIKDELRRDAYLAEIASALKLNEHAVRKSFAEGPVRAPARQETPRPGDESDAERPCKATYKAFRQSPDDIEVLRALLHNPELRSAARGCLKEVPFPDSDFGRVLRIVLEDEAEAQAAVREAGGGAARLYAAAAAGEPQPGDKARRIVEQRLRSIEREALKHRTAALEEAIRQAESMRDQERVRDLLREMMALRAQLQALEAA